MLKIIFFGKRGRKIDLIIGLTIFAVYFCFKLLVIKKSNPHVFKFENITKKNNQIIPNVRLFDLNKSIKSTSLEYNLIKCKIATISTVKTTLCIHRNEADWNLGVWEQDLMSN